LNLYDPVLLLNVVRADHGRSGGLGIRAVPHGWQRGSQTDAINRAGVVNAGPEALYKTWAQTAGRMATR